MRFTDSLINAISSRLATEIHTALPGKIESYDYRKQKANVKPLVKKKLRDGTSLSMPVVVNVPVVFPGSGGGSLTFPVSVGDNVLLIFSERALESWLTLGGEQEPGDPRKFSITDAIAIPGLFSFADDSLAENNTDCLLIQGDGRLQISESSLLLKFLNAQVKIADGTIALGTSTNELIDIIETLCGVLRALAVDPATHIINPATQSLIQAQENRLTAIKGSL